MKYKVQVKILLTTLSVCMWTIAINTDFTMCNICMVLALLPFVCSVSITCVNFDLVLFDLLAWMCSQNFVLKLQPVFPTYFSLQS